MSAKDLFPTAGIERLCERISSGTMRVVAAAVLVAALAAGCDDNGQKYSQSDVERAFRSQGLVLLAPNRGEDNLLVAMNTEEHFGVAIYRNEKNAANAFRTLRSQATSETFDARKGNVVVTSDEAVTASMRKRIQGALAELG